jgi:hypothetical protein
MKVNLEVKNPFVEPFDNKFNKLFLELEWKTLKAEMTKPHGRNRGTKVKILIKNS